MKKWIWYIQKSIERNNLVYILKKTNNYKCKCKIKIYNLYESDNYLDFYKINIVKTLKCFKDRCAWDGKRNHPVQNQ